MDEHTISTNDWFVVFSAGESGNEDLYFRCTYIANYIKIEGFLYWNAATNTGVQQYNSASNFNILDADVPTLWIYGDLDAVFCISRQTSVSATFYPIYFGKLINSLYDQTVVTSAAALTAGTDVVVDVGTVPASWFVGMRLFVRDNTRIDRTAAITAKTASTITVTLAYSYAAGAKICADIGYVVNGNNQFSSSLSALIDHAGTKNATVSAFTAASSTIQANGNPEPLNSEHLVVPFVSASVANGNLGETKNVFNRATTGMTALNVYEDAAGANYRAFSVYSGANIVVMEV